MSAACGLDLHVQWFKLSDYLTVHACTLIIQLLMALYAALADDKLQEGGEGTLLLLQPVLTQSEPAVSHVVSITGL